MHPAKRTAPLATALLLLATGCVGDGKGDGGSDSPSPAAQVEIEGFRYEPGTVKAEAGGEVTWKNGDEAPHTATAEDRAFDTGTLKEGTSKSLRVRPGTYSYFCRFHPFMRGKLEVSG